MNIIIAGGTGLVGSELVRTLSRLDDTKIYILTRSESNEVNPYLQYVNWDDMKELLPINPHIIINLAGATLNKKWTDEYKQEILNSRLHTIDSLYQYVDSLSVKPHTYINASAVGYYPTSQHVKYDEGDVFQSHDFLSGVVSRIEYESDKFSQFDTRVVKTRFGIILDREQGALSEMIKPYKFGVGGKIGSGKQWMSWIHIDDAINALLFLIFNEDVCGPVNVVAPHAERQENFSKTLASVMDKPNMAIVPKPIIKAILGERSQLILEGQSVQPSVLLDKGFKYKYPMLEQALNHLIHIKDYS